MHARLSWQPRSRRVSPQTAQSQPQPSSSFARLSLFVGSTTEDNLSGSWTRPRKSICEPIYEEPSPLAESSDLAVEDLEIYKRHHRPRPPLTRTQSAPLLLSTTTTRPFHINPSRCVPLPPAHTCLRTHLPFMQPRHGLPHAEKRLCSPSRPEPDGLQDRHHRCRSQGHAQRDLRPRQDRQRPSNEKGTTRRRAIDTMSLTLALGIRHRDAILFLPLYALPRQACQRTGDVSSTDGLVFAYSNATQ